MSGFNIFGDLLDISIHKRHHLFSLQACFFNKNSTEHRLRFKL